MDAIWESRSGLTGDFPQVSSRAVSPAVALSFSPLPSFSLLSPFLPHLSASLFLHLSSLGPCGPFRLGFPHRELGFPSGLHFRFSRSFRLSIFPLSSSCTGVFIRAIPNSHDNQSTTPNLFSSFQQKEREKTEKYKREKKNKNKKNPQPKNLKNTKKKFEKERKKGRKN